jgi:hypothetical protein
MTHTKDETQPAPVQEPVADAMARYLRVCSSGGMPKKLQESVQSLVYDAERLGYFKATTPPAAPVQPVAWAEYNFKKGKFTGLTTDDINSVDSVGDGCQWVPQLQALAAQPAPKNRKDALRKLLLSEDGLTAQDCEWVNEVKEGDLVKLRGGQSVAVVKSVYRQRGLAPDYYTLILAGGDTLELSGDELADLYEPAAPVHKDVNSTQETTETRMDAGFAGGARPAPVQPVAWLEILRNNKTATDEVIGAFLRGHAEHLTGETFVLTTPPAAQPAVPDAIHHTDLSESLEYIQGWNDCRAEMLKGMKS